MNKTTKAIEIDLDVFKALNNQITYIDEPLNDVLRRLLLTNQNAGPITTRTNKFLYIVNKKVEVNAKGIELPNGGIKVYKGSKIRRNQTPGFSGSYANLRNQMIKDQYFDNNYELRQDYEFGSLSAAASVILGSQQNADPWKINNY